MATGVRRTESSDVAPDAPDRREGGAGVAPELVFESTVTFERDLANLAPHDRPRVVDAINARCGLALTDREGFERGTSRPFAPRLAPGLDPTLSVIELDGDLRLIAAVDDDPMFGRLLVSLFRLAGRHEADDAYRDVARRLYEAQACGRRG